MGIPVQNYLGASGLPPALDIAHAVVMGSFTSVGATPAFAFQGWANIAIWCGFNTTLTLTDGSLTASVTAAGSIAAGSAINSSKLPPGSTVGAISGTSVTLDLPVLTLYGKLRADRTIHGLPSTKYLLGAAVAGPNIPVGATVTNIVRTAVLSPSYPGGASIMGIVEISATPTGTLPVENVASPFTFAVVASQVAAGADAAAIFTGASIGASASVVNLERSFDGGATWIVCNIGAAGTIAQFNGGPISTSWAEPERGVCYRLNCIAYSVPTVSEGTTTLNYRLSQTAGAAMSLTTGGVI